LAVQGPKAMELVETILNIDLKKMEFMTTLEG